MIKVNKKKVEIGMKEVIIKLMHLNGIFFANKGWFDNNIYYEKVLPNLLYCNLYDYFKSINLFLIFLLLFSIFNYKGFYLFKSIKTIFF